MIEKMHINMISRISFALGFLSIFVPFFGLILGIFGIEFSKKAKKEMFLTDEGGSGLATLGFICSLIGITIQVIILIAYILFTSLIKVS